MRKTGVIDLRDGETAGPDFSVHLFSRSGGGCSYLSTVKAAQGTPERELAGISDFFLSLPLGMLSFRTMKFPFSDREKLMKILPFELENVIMNGAGQIVFDALVTGRSGEDHDVLAVCIEKDILGNLLERLLRCGIDPKVVTSLELRSVLRGEGNLAERLLAQESIEGNARRTLAAEEIVRPTLNLRTGALAYTKEREGIKKSLKMTLMLTLVLLIVISLSLSVQIVHFKRESSVFKKDMRTLYTSLFPEDRKITDELYQLKSRMREVQEKGETLGGVRPLDLLMRLSKGTLQGVHFNEISIERDVITLKGEASSLSALDKVKADLSVFLKDVSAPDIKPQGDGKIFFTVISKGEK